jgi:hypothetical protein
LRNGTFIVHKVPSVAALYLKRFNGYADIVHKLDSVRSCVGGLLQIHEKKNEEYDNDCT